MTDKNKIEIKFTAPAKELKTIQNVLGNGFPDDDVSQLFKERWEREEKKLKPSVEN